MFQIGSRQPFVNYTTGIKKKKTQEGVLFDSAIAKRYYSSLDTEIYFGDQFIDDVVHIRFDVQQNAMPLFGYGSYVYDELALGNRMVQGEFTINFTSPGYLVELLNELRNTRSISASNYDVLKQREGLEEEEQTTMVNNLKAEEKPLWDTLFDIDIMYGQKTGGSNQAHIVIEGIQIMGYSQELDISGNPIYERYTFMARDYKTIS